jgi:hypothetical protein
MLVLLKDELNRQSGAQFAALKTAFNAYDENTQTADAVLSELSKNSAHFKGHLRVLANQAIMRGNTLKVLQEEQHKMQNKR